MTPSWFSLSGQGTGTCEENGGVKSWACGWNQGRVWIFSDQKESGQGHAAGARARNEDQSWGLQAVTQEGPSGPCDREEAGAGGGGDYVPISPAEGVLSWHNFTSQQLMIKSLYSVLEISLNDSKNNDGL